jgi:hypothetical protein
METDSQMISEGEILSVVVAPERPSLTVDAAQSLLELRFSPTQIERMHELADKNNAGTLTSSERAEMESYARVGNFLSLIQSKARLSLKTASHSWPLAMDAALQRRIWRRARAICEYCRMPQSIDALPFHIDHIIARQHMGRTKSANLALACYNCNLHKGPNIAGLDPDTGQLTRLFNPRTDDWDMHFRSNGAHLMGLTAIGRTTIGVLAINQGVRVSHRASLIAEGVAF